jgi:hypothetical protein
MALTQRDRPTLPYAQAIPSPLRLDSGVAAFWLGLLFLPSFIFTGWGSLHGELNPFGVLAWLALGIIATCFVGAAWEERTLLGARTRMGRAGTVLVLFGWILGLMTMFGPRHDPHGLDVRQQVKCASNLRQIGQAMLLYADSHGGHYPDRPEELLFTQDITAECFICPSTDDTPAAAPTTQGVSDAFASGGHFSYVYLGKGRSASEMTPQHVAAYESRYNHTRDHAGIHVLYGDGRVEFLQDRQAQQLIDKLKKGQNPPTGGVAQPK